MNRPWFKLYAADLLLDSKFDAIPLEAQAIVLRMWCVCHLEGFCPAEMGELARKIRCSADKVLKHRSVYESFFDLLSESPSHLLCAPLEFRYVSRRMEHEKRRSEINRQNANKRLTGFAQQTVQEIAKPSSDSDSIVLSKESIPNKARPSLEEVRAYCAERGSVVDADRWFDFYMAKGWKIGKNLMKDWRAAVRTWEPEKVAAERKIIKCDECQDSGKLSDGEACTCLAGQQYAWGVQHQADIKKRQAVAR